MQHADDPLPCHHRQPDVTHRRGKAVSLWEPNGICPFGQHNCQSLPHKLVNELRVNVKQWLRDDGAVLPTSKKPREVGRFFVHERNGNQVTSQQLLRLGQHDPQYRVGVQRLDDGAIDAQQTFQPS
ncbi:hypothetical protein HRbin17_02713 [bacterium HR17]|uniref:Uncharacterized protein n=1 Tax=Candidatus Fervidibacter japonicus TaxID=2035412 RepID=A0A2H5XG72_9BACT|nr:hypothetical protein HRbin17_02713 [bacterium HR17]